MGEWQDKSSGDGKRVLENIEMIEGKSKESSRCVIVFRIMRPIVEGARDQRPAVPPWIVSSTTATLTGRDLYFPPAIQQNNKTCSVNEEIKMTAATAESESRLEVQ